ncbi:MAG: hypothetical protein JRH18_01510 [Deltaproteobacteria bacterium]|nr:hypothetical protein [Deltaproteobacteria bacterium]MBW1960262.1 hypothetical protein [Deltaproteobacteria bacterium]MBW1994915.1 hypothetical protein [Deltaproteobacteria bacterium]MBW2150325.1 hypothetical protein [Deltaproteobacteria bacterium]
MKELEKFLKTLAEGMKALAQGVEAIAEKVDALAESPSLESLKGKSSARAYTKKTEKDVPKDTSSTMAAATSASEAVFKIIARSNTGVDTATIMKETGFSQKKIYNIIYRLKKTGKIKSVGKGVYTKT